MDEVTEAVNNLNISDGGATAAGGGAEGHKKNRIQVSNTKKPLFFYVNLAKRYMQLHNEVELSALGMGELRGKTHFKSKKTHSSIQGKRRRPIRARHSAAHGFMGPLEQVTDLDKSYYLWISDEGPPSSHPTKVGPIQGGRRLADQPDRPTCPQHQPTSGFDVAAPHWS
ncbi:uncharacterized protein LOC120682084 isoform X1 [Panicum virgatum]|uniref:uncharacterized protein LOC120682084 isoform X1 n=1 Tax=Panicum virgatum TaxID=38727 RepID=UPI0019D5AD62|nr:uncharacterized protein LOC120682084 isoform X1 [Panicum virgatum]